MRDKLLIYAVAASIGVHLLVLVLVGKTSAARPIAVEQLKVVHVDLVKTPERVEVHQDKPEPPKPRVQPPKIETPRIPPIKRMVTDRTPPKPEPQRTRRQTRAVEPPAPRRVPAHTPGPQPRNPNRTTVSRVPGDPGGALAGVGSPRGQDLGRVPSGSTPVGWVPGADRGAGSGSGSGPGVGRPDPVPDARPGPGREPAPAPKEEPPPPPPPPKYVTMTVCAASGMLPGQHCERKDSKSYRDGAQPGRVCTECKPRHVSTLADRSEPELVKDVSVKVPDVDEPGDYTVRIRYTVGKDGSVSGVEVTDSSGVPAIDRAVVNAAKKMRYKPAVQNGEPRSVIIKRKYRIRL